MRPESLRPSWRSCSGSCLALRSQLLRSRLPRAHPRPTSPTHSPSRGLRLVEGWMAPRRVRFGHRLRPRASGWPCAPPQQRARTAKAIRLEAAKARRNPKERRVSAMTVLARRARLTIVASLSMRISWSKASSKSRTPTLFCVARSPPTIGRGSTRNSYLWSLSPYRILCSNPGLGGWTPICLYAPHQHRRPAVGAPPSNGERNARAFPLANYPRDRARCEASFSPPLKQKAENKPGSTCHR